MPRTRHLLLPRPTSRRMGFPSARTSGSAVCPPAVLGVIVSLLCCPSVLADELLAGTAKLDLTPPKRVPLAGYSRRKGALSTGVHDPVFVRALVLREGTTRVALVSCDLLIIDEVLFHAVQEQLRHEPTWLPTTIILAATHTHSGPGAYGRVFLEKLSMGHYDPEIATFLSSRIAQAVLAASAQLQPVTVRAGSVATDGLVVNRMTSDGPTDSELSVVALDDAQGVPRAVVAGFAAHPTTLGAWNTQVSADYPGSLAAVVEAAYPSAICLFLSGNVGDQAPVKHGEGFEAATYLGETLAKEAVALIDGTPRGESAKLAASQRVVELPSAQVRLGRWTLPRWLSRSLADDDATIALAAVGSVLFIGVPCDLSVALGRELKQYAQSRGYQPLIVGFANDYIGYCMPPSVYETDHYEATLMLNGPAAGVVIVEELKQMIDDLVAKSPSGRVAK